MIPAAIFLIGLLLAPWLARRLCHGFGLIKPNFRGQVIPAATGLTFVLIVALASVLWPRSIVGETALAFGLLGLIDDRWGNRAVGGFRGHLKALVSGRPTTGAVKLVGGGLCALVAAWRLDGPTWLLPLDAALIALAANALNLLDTRPGRAQFGFALLAAPIAVVTGEKSLLPALAAAGIEWRADAAGRSMMGDTGSNLLGAAAGTAAALALPPLARIALLAALLLLNLAAERVSLSAVIARTPWLDALDRRLGVRGVQ